MNTPKVPAADLLDEMMARFKEMPPEQQAAMTALVKEATGRMHWVPNPGAQTEAFYSEVDELLYGGRAGGGKSDILIGLACQEHQRSLLLRRHNKEVHFLVDRTEEILGHAKGRNSQLGRWYLPDDRLIMYGGCQHLGDEKGYKGEPKDLLGIDEASEFLEAQVDFLSGWLRTKKVGQRTRMVLATNPPTTTDGEWLVRWFAPWLDPEHPLFPYPECALLYFERLKDGAFRWEKEPFEVTLPNGRKAAALSRTFIPADLLDNPDYDRSNYASRLAALPEELRRRYERGEFIADAVDDEWQVIPTKWIDQAQKRWTPLPPDNAMMTAMGVDIAQGGGDRTVLAPRYDTWYAPLIIKPGTETPDGPTAAALVVKHQRDGAQINIDMGGGWGGSCYDHLKGNDIASVLGVNPSGASTGKTVDGKLGFANKRAEMMWRFREVLDPTSGFNIALPPGATVKADLAAARWKLTASGIRIEEKTEIKKRLGRSPDEGEAVMLSWFSGGARVRALGAQRSRQHRNLPAMSVNPSRPKWRHGQRRRGGGGADEPREMG